MLSQDDSSSPELLALITRFEVAVAEKRRMIRELHDTARANRELIDEIRHRDADESG